jgi:hypothetical protein
MQAAAISDGGEIALGCGQSPILRLIKNRTAVIASWEGCRISLERKRGGKEREKSKNREKKDASLTRHPENPESR